MTSRLLLVALASAASAASTGCLSMALALVSPVNPIDASSGPCLAAFNAGGTAGARAPAGPVVQAQLGHVGWLNQIEVTPDGRHAVTGEAVRPVRLKLWELETGREVLSYDLGASAVLQHFQLSGDGRRVLASSEKGLFVFDTQGGQVLASCNKALTAAVLLGLSPDRRYAASMALTSMEPLTSDLVVWETATGQIHARTPMVFPSHPKFSPDGKALLLASSARTLELYDLDARRVVRTVRLASDARAYAFSKDGATLYAGGDDGKVAAFDRTTGQPRGAPMAALPHAVLSLADSGGQRLVVGGAQGELGTLDLSRPAPVTPFARAGQPAAAVSPDGASLFVATPGKLFLWRLADGQPQQIWTPEQQVPRESALFLAGGARVALLQHPTPLQQQVEVLDVAQKKTLWRSQVFDTPLADSGTLTATPEGGHLVLSYGTAVEPFGQMAQVLEASTGRLVRTLSLSSGGAVFGTRQMTAFGVAGGKVAVPLVSSGAFRLQLIDAGSGAVALEQELPQGAGIARGVSANGKQLFFAANRSPDGQFTKAPWAWVFDVEQRSFAAGRSLDSGLDQYYVTSLDRGPSGGWLTGAWSQPTLLFGAAGAPRQLPGGSIRASSFSPDGKRLVWTGDDGFVRIGTSAGDELVRLASFDDGEWVLMTPGGSFAASAAGAQYLSVRAGGKLYAIDQFHEKLYRPDLVLAALGGAKAEASQELAAVLQQGAPPAVRLIAPSGVEGKRDVELEVELTDAGGGIGKVEWRINGAVIGVTGERGLKAVGAAPKAAEKRTEKKLLTLGPGENLIEVVAYNADGALQSRPASLRLSMKDEISEPPALHVLAVAINQYRDRTLKLSYAVPDAKSLAESFQRAGKTLFTKVDATLLLDADATSAGLAAAFGAVAAKASPNDVFVLFIAGHGITVDGRYHFLPVDFRYQNEDSVRERGVNQDDLQKWMSAVQAKKSLVLLDTCNSGSFVQAQAVTRGMTEKTAIDKLTRATGRATIAASTDTQVALEGHAGHGVFTWAVLSGLLEADARYGNKDGVVTTGELAAFINEQVPEVTYKRWGYEQVPQVNLHGREFPIGLSTR